jgi:hypothetical protein
MQVWRQKRSNGASRFRSPTFLADRGLLSCGRGEGTFQRERDAHAIQRDLIDFEDVPCASRKPTN